MRTKAADVKVGDRYVGWGKTWEVVRVWPYEGVAEARNVDKHASTIRIPITQFRELVRA